MLQQQVYQHGPLMAGYRKRYDGDMQRCAHVSHAVRVSTFLEQFPDHVINELGSNRKPWLLELLADGTFVLSGQVHFTLILLLSLPIYYIVK